MTLPTTARITRTVRFSAAHRYHTPALSDEENRRVFGACNSPHGHGHNYRVDVTLEGAVDPVTGMVMNLADLDRLLKERVVQPLDHTFLNLDVPHFRTVVPTCENLALHVMAELRPLAAQLQGARLLRVRVWESEDLYAEAGGGEG